jgi:hypothetical protein
MNTPWPPRPAELAEWPIVWRERWGRLANDLEDRDVLFPESERQAFEKIKAEKMAEEAKAPSVKESEVSHGSPET